MRLYDPAPENTYGFHRSCEAVRFYIYPPGRWWCYGCGRAVRFHRDELDRWIDSRNRK
jgi:hypothetical protein